MTEQEKKSIQEEQGGSEEQSQTQTPANAQEESQAEPQINADQPVNVQEETIIEETISSEATPQEPEEAETTEIQMETTVEEEPATEAETTVEEEPVAETKTEKPTHKETIAEQLERATSSAPEMHKWFVVQVLSSHEKKVKKALEEQREHSGMVDLISEILLPTENVSEVKKGEQQIVEKRLWPGYLLVKMTMTDDSWTYVKGTPGVIDFLGGSQATPLTDREVAEILADLEKKRNTITQRHKFQVSDRVKIIDGVFVNFIGTVTEVFHEKGRLNALVNIFGRDTQVDDLDFTQVEEISDEEVNT